MTARFRISEQDYARALVLHSRPTRWRLIAMAVIAVALASAAAVATAPWRLVAIGALVWFVAVLGTSYALVPWIARRHYRKYKAMQGEFSLDLQDDGLRLSTSLAQGTVLWDHMLKWRRNDAYILIYPMPRLFHVVPTSIASQGFDLDALLGELRSRVGAPK